jgi:hypothetical protein
MSSSSARPASQKAASSRRTLRGVLAVLLFAAIVAAGLGASAYFGRTPQPVVSETQSTTVSSISRSNDPITVIISSANRNDCHRYQLHNTTGAMNDRGVGDCMRDPDEGSGQGTRIEEISKGFRNR